MSKKSVLVVASLAYDGIETIENKVDNVLGGAGTYICLSLKNFSSEYSIVSVVGKDFKREDLNLLENCGVDISGIKIEKNNKTFYWSCIYTDNFKERITTKTELNVMESFNPIISKNKSNPDILLLGNLHPEIQLSAINQLNNKVAGRRTNPIDQAEFYPGDQSFDRVPALAKSNFNFGAPN